jgi:nucleotidyltransferase/DNA polymerase involved in DNA repair
MGRLVYVRAARVHDMAPNGGLHAQLGAKQSPAAAARKVCEAFHRPIAISIPNVISFPEFFCLYNSGSPEIFEIFHIYSDPIHIARVV